jgi:hypothetical protein
VDDNLYGKPAVLDLGILDELCAAVKRIPIKLRYRLPLRIARDFGAVVVLDADDKMVACMASDTWDSFLREGRVIRG